MLIAGIIVYNEARMLPGCLESIHRAVDRIVVVDGAYEHFPHTEAYSTDVTREIANVYGAEWVNCPPGGWARQFIKRTAYLAGRDGDWYLHIDADERLAGEIPPLEDGRTYALLIENRAGVPGWAPRIFQHRGWMRYEGSHNALWSDDHLITVHGAVKVDPRACRLLHLAHLREPERIAAKREYYGWQKPAERAYRRGHGI